MGLRDDILTDAASAWFDTDGLAQTVTYKAGGSGAGISLAAVLEYGADAEPESAPRGYIAMYYRRVGTAIIQAADVASPAEGDTITVGSEIWTVRAIESGNGFHWRLAIDKDIKTSAVR